jgi:hypothetical protein
VKLRVENSGKESAGTQLLLNEFISCVDLYFAKYLRRPFKLLVYPYTDRLKVDIKFNWNVRWLFTWYIWVNTLCTEV